MLRNQVLILWDKPRQYGPDSEHDFLGKTIKEHVKYGWSRLSCESKIFAIELQKLVNARGE